MFKCNCETKLLTDVFDGWFDDEFDDVDCRIIGVCTWKAEYLLIQVVLYEIRQAEKKIFF